MLECYYIVSIYHKKDITDTNVLNTIYNSSIAVFSNKFTKTELSATLDTNDLDVYVTVIGVIQLGNKQEERVLYDFTEPIELPKKYEVKAEKEHVNDKISSLDKTNDNSLFEIEISDGISTKESNYSIDIAIELYYDIPTYKNDTHLHILSRRVSTIKRSVVVQCEDAKEKEIMISLIIPLMSQFYYLL